MPAASSRNRHTADGAAPDDGVSLGGTQTLAAVGSSKGVGDGFVHLHATADSQARLQVVASGSCHP